jgi:hypothetical protein
MRLPLVDARRSFASMAWLMRRLASLLLLLGTALSCHAMPSYARQTGMECSGCHVGAFGPQLTPAGILFKVTGYSDSDGKEGKIPLSAMVVASWTRTRADQNPAPEHLKTNNNLTLNEASLFLAGRLADRLGAFVQVTHNGVDHSTALDQTDIRFADTVNLGGTDTVLGLSLNNNPGVQDPFNTMPIWSFPFTSSEAGFGTGETATLINGGLEGRVLGLNAYALWSKTIYAELGTYRSLSPKAQDELGLGTDPQRLGSNVYWRLAWMADMKSQAFHAGLFGWDARLSPDRAAAAPQDRYGDIGIDAGYQFLGTREHIVTVNASHIAERRTDGAGGGLTRLRESRLNASYHFQQTWGASAGWFSTTGSDPGARTSGTLWQVDWTPWGKEDHAAPEPFGFANLRLGVQLWHYDHFGGDAVSARSHDTAFLFAWGAF